ncbi:MAG: hypothetical protein ACRDZN_04380 [Acidimicrobiales bacterium]
MPKRKGIRVPHFASLDDERAWFEEHADEVEGVELAENPFAGRTRKVAYSLRLDAADIERLEAAAGRRGMRPTQLARSLIRTGLAATKAAGGESEQLADLATRLRATADVLESTHTEIYRDIAVRPGERPR